MVAPAITHPTKPNIPPITKNAMGSSSNKTNPIVPNTSPVSVVLSGDL